jgi:Spermidine/putrescine-binding periplasmic protein
MKNMKKLFTAIFSTILMLALVSGCGNGNDKQTLKVFNWGEYIDMDVISAFEEEFDVRVIYDTFESNEAMYSKISAGSVSYDVIFPSDYMVERMIKEDMLEELDYSKIPNLSNIQEDLLNADFDPEQKYSVPYFWGTVGIVYDQTIVKANEVTSWDILWNEKYNQQIYMYNSSRDSMMVALKRLGYSMNTQDQSQIAAATAALIEQKPIVYGYVTDEVISSMANSQAALAVVYSGDATSIMRENSNMAYAIPKEGSNIWIDPMVIPKSAEEKDLAHEFINFLARADIALLNTEEVGYSTPNNATLDLLSAEGEEWITWLSYNPDLDTLTNMEFFHAGSDELLEIYNKAWEDVISA